MKPSAKAVSAAKTRLATACEGSPVLGRTVGEPGVDGTGVGGVGDGGVGDGGVGTGGAGVGGAGVGSDEESSTLCCRAQRSDHFVVPCHV